MSLETDVLPFGFIKTSSTVMCTSMLKETIYYCIIMQIKLITA